MSVLNFGLYWVLIFSRLQKKHKKSCKLSLTSLAQSDKIMSGLRLCGGMDMRNFFIVTIAGIALALPTVAFATMFFVYECVDAIAVNVGEEYSGSTVGATSIGESSCGYNDKYAVWHSYTPQSNKTVIISLCGSAFDTTLSVFDSCGGIELACNDDYCDPQSELMIDLTAGQTYLIRVAGYDGQTGDYTLTIVETIPADVNVGLTIDNLWMYQNLPGATGSNLTVNVSIADDPLSNNSYSYEWEFVLPSDVGIAPTTVDGGRTSDAFWTFAARGCDEPWGLSDSGQAFTAKVTITGDDYGNTGTAEIEFGIALLGDVNNDAVVNVADCSIVDVFWQTGSAGSYSLRDCDVNCDGVVNVADRSITDVIRASKLGWNRTVSPCQLR